MFFSSSPFVVIRGGEGRRGEGREEGRAGQGEGRGRGGQGRARQGMAVKGRDWRGGEGYTVVVYQNIDPTLVIRP